MGHAANSRPGQLRVFRLSQQYETVWPWYSHVAPVSWLLQKDVDEGRKTLNFSEWGTTWLNYGSISKVVAEGEMPPGQYLIMRPEARLSRAEKESLLEGLQSSIK